MNKTPEKNFSDKIAYVPVPKDLTKVKTKIALNLTKRQLICFGVAAAVGVPTYLFTRTTIGNDAAVLLMIGIMLPFFFLAMFEKDGQPAEKVVKNMLRQKIWPSARPYKTENMYRYLKEEAMITNTKKQTTGKTRTKIVSKRHPSKEK